MKKRRSTVATVTALVIIAAVVLILVTKRRQLLNGQAIRIGVILPLTGDAAQYGKACQRGVTLAIEQLDTKGGVLDRELRVIYEDSQAIPKAAVSSINKLISLDRVHVVVGDMFSSTSLAIAPIAQESRVVLISPTASSGSVPRTGDHVFSIYPSDAYDGQFLGNELIRRWSDSSRVAIVYAQAEAMVTCKDAFRSAIKNAGFEVTSEDGVPPGTPDLSTVATRVAGGRPQVVFCALYLPELAALLREAARQGLTAKFVGVSTCYDPSLFELAGKDADGLIFSAPFFDVGSSAVEVTAFVSAYEHRFGEKPNVWGAYGYDVIRIAARGLELADGDLSRLPQALAGISGFPGATGTTSFNPDGSVVKDMRLLRADFSSRTFPLVVVGSGD